MFDLAGLLDELPAAAFFDYDKVSVENNLKFRYLLSKLVTLFITPHYHPIFPYEEASYFGKFISYNRWHNNTNSTLKVVLGSIPDYVTIKKCYVEKTTAADITRPGAETLTESVTSWFFDAASTPVLVVKVTTVTKTESGGVTDGHATFLALKKSEGRIQFIYINPWGFDPASRSSISRYVKAFTSLMTGRLQKIVGAVPVVPLVTRCPTLQTVPQGGNCASWQLMLFVFFLWRPQYFDDPMPLLEQLGRHPVLNMLLFSLFVFLKKLSNLPNVHYDFFMSSTKYGQPIKEVIQKGVAEDTTFRNHLFTLFRDSTNCSSYTVDQCPIICKKCEGKCATGFAVRRVDTEACHLLTPKELITEMVEVDNKLHEFSGTEYSEEEKQKRDSILKFNVPTTLKEYSRYGIQLDGQQFPFLTAAQIKEIEDEENSKKRAREQEELYERVGKRRRF